MRLRRDRIDACLDLLKGIRCGVVLPAAAAAAAAEGGVVARVEDVPGGSAGMVETDGSGLFFADGGGFRLEVLGVGFCEEGGGDVVGSSLRCGDYDVSESFRVEGRGHVFYGGVR